MHGQKLENVHGEGLLVAVSAAFIAVPALINWDFACDAITVDLVKTRDNGGKHCGKTIEAKGVIFGI